MAVSSIGTNQAHEERKVNPQNRPHRTFVMCDTLPKGKVSLATITESWRSSAKRQPGRRLGSRSSGEGHQRRFDRTEPFHRIDLVAQTILIAKIRIPDHGDRLIQTLMALRQIGRASCRERGCQYV